MRPKFYPSLVNDRFGDPAVFIDFLLERRAILFDLGDIHALPPRSVLRLTDIFVSHTHIDHFAGFDRLLRLLVGRPKLLRLYGPPGFKPTTFRRSLPPTPGTSPKPSATTSSSRSWNWRTPTAAVAPASA